MIFFEKKKRSVYVSIFWEYSNFRVKHNKHLLHKCEMMLNQIINRSSQIFILYLYWSNGVDGNFCGCKTGLYDIMGYGR